MQAPATRPSTGATGVNVLNQEVVFGGSRTKHLWRALAHVLWLGVVAALVSTGASVAADEPVRSLTVAPPRVEVEPSPDLGFEPPPPAYPIHPVEQIAFHGTRHGFVNTTKGNLVFRATDLELRGRTPITSSRVYDSASGDAVAQANPPMTDPRWTQDLGPNWILSYSDCLVPTTDGYVMATADGDRIYWVAQSGNAFTRQTESPSRHMVLARTNATTLLETQSDGSKWTYRTLTGTNGTYVLTRIQDRSGSNIQILYSQGYSYKVYNNSGQYLNLTRPILDPNYPTVVFPRSRVVKIADNTGREVLFDFDSSGRLTTVTDALDHDWTYGYDAGTKLTSATDPLSNTFLTASYDASGRAETVTTDAGPWTFEYSDATGVTTATDALDHEWTYTRNAATGITTQIEEPTGGTHTITLDGSNNPETYAGPEDETATWTYDAKHRVLTHRPPTSESATEVFAWDATNGWLNSVTSVSGAVTTFTRDAAGRVTEEEIPTPPDPDGTVWKSTYATNGDRLTFQLPKGSELGGDAFKWTFTYNATGNVASATDPTDREFTLDYTAPGDLWKVRRPCTETVIEPPLGGEGMMMMMGGGGEEEPLATICEWIYDRDTLGRLIATTDPLGNTWERVYDAAGRLEHVIGPAGTRLRYEYDEFSRLAAIVVQTEGETGPTTEFTYDAAGRLAAKEAPSGATWAYTHDGSGRLIGITDPLGRTWTYTRDLSGRIETITYPGGRTVTIERNAGGQITDRFFPGGRTELFQYDGIGRLTLARADEPSNLRDGDVYDWNGRIEWEYDALARPTRVQTIAAAVPSGWGRDLHFTYDVNGNRTNLTVAFHADVSYGYDELDRLISAQVEGGNEWEITYDPNSGDRTSVVSGSNWEEWTYDHAGHVLANRWSQDPGAEVGVGDLEYSVDEEGRVIAQVDSITGVSKSVIYGPSGLVHFESEDDGTTSTTTGLLYDFDGHLLTRVAAAETETYPPAAAPTDELAAFEWDAAGRLTYARKGSLTRAYTWVDAPEQQDVAVKIWRAPNDLTEKAAEIDLGYDGRLRRVFGHHSLEGEGLIARYRWAPTLMDLVVDKKELELDGSGLEVSTFAAEVGDYFGQQGEHGELQRITSPVAAVDGALRILSASGGTAEPDSEDAFRVGRWDRSATTGPSAWLATGSGSTAVYATKSLIGELLSTAQHARATIANTSPVHRNAPGFEDDWANVDLLGNAIARTQGTPISAATRSSTEPRSGDGQVGPMLSCDAWYCYQPNDPRAEEVNVCSWGPTWFSNIPLPTDCSYYIDRRLLHGRSGNQCLGWFNRLGRPSDSMRYPDMSPWRVSFENGAFVESVTDLKVFDPAGDITFTRTYRSDHPTKGILGYNWTHPWEDRLDVYRESQCPELVTWLGARGEVVHFSRPYGSTGEYTGTAESMVRLKGLPDGRWALRSVTGEIKWFSSDGDLESIRDRGRDLTFTRVGGRITEVWAGPTVGPTKRFDFVYQTAAPFLLERIEGGGQSVTYAYEDGELVTVTSDALKLGYGKDGSELAGEVSPSTTYSYQNIWPGCPSVADVGCHLLTRIQEAQFNPLVDGAPHSELVVANLYAGNDVVGAADPNFSRVMQQCIGRPGAAECSAENADVAYAYELWFDQNQQLTKTTTLVDRRLAPRLISEVHEYDDAGNLRCVEQDAGTDPANLKAETTLEYYGGDKFGLVSRTDYPDHSCRLNEYALVGGIYRLTVDRKPTREHCESRTTGPGDQITAYTYAPVNGKYHSVTGPQAFEQTGEVPAQFDPEDPSVSKYTTFYYYDFDQDAVPGAGEFHNLCTDWDLEPCSLAVGNVNDRSEDDSYRYGNLIATKRIAERESDNVIVSDQLWNRRLHQRSGRPLWQKGPDGVQTDYTYYEANENWTDWSEPTSSTTGEGPLKATTVRPTDAATPLVKRFAWDSSGHLLAARDPAGVRVEFKYDGGSTLQLEETVCAPTADGSCWTAETPPALDGNGRTLRVSRSTFDLGGHRVRSAVHDPTVTGWISDPMTSSWTTYDVFGRPTSSTVDPEPTATPGDPRQVSFAHLHLVSRAFYDGRGQPVKLVTPAGRVSSTEYDALGRAVSLKRYEILDPGGSTLPGTHPMDVTVGTRYDASGRPWRVTDPLGTPTYSWYDRFGRLAFTSDGKPSAAVCPVLLGADAELCGTGTPNPASWYRETTYDIRGSVVRSRFFGRNGRGTSGFLEAKWAAHDNLGRGTRSWTAVEPTGVVSSVVADQLFLDALHDSDPMPPHVAQNTKFYRNNGQLWKTRDAASHETEVTYDGFGREWKTLAPLSHGTRDSAENRFDVAGRPETTIRTAFDQNGHPHEEQQTAMYDEWGRVASQRAGSSSTWSLTTYTYDALSRTLSTTDRWLEAGRAAPMIGFVKHGLIRLGDASVYERRRWRARQSCGLKPTTRTIPMA